MSVKTYDAVSLLDLVHVLRLWTELKSKLPQMCADFENKKPFETATPIKKTVKAVKGQIYFLSYLPNNGVVTFASQGSLISGPSIDAGPLTAAVKMMKKSNGSFLLYQACFVSSALDESSRRAIEKSNVKRCNFANWLGAETIRVRFNDAGGQIHCLPMSREIVVKRLANVLDASHSSLAQDEVERSNRFDAPIKWLMQYKCGGLPIPYFLALKVAQDMLQYLPKLLQQENEV